MRLIIVQVLKKLFTFTTKPEGSLPCSQELPTGFYPEEHESSSHPITSFFYVHFNNIIQFIFGFSAQNFVCVPRISAKLNCGWKFVQCSSCGNHDISAFVTQTMNGRESEIRQNIDELY
jgi:hypothetical protein